MNEKYIFILEIDMHIHARTDEEAIKIARSIVAKEKQKFDNKAEISGLYKKPDTALGLPVKII